jgi:hypothetical protein
MNAYSWIPALRSDGQGRGTGEGSPSRREKQEAFLRSSEEGFEKNLGGVLLSHTVAYELGWEQKNLLKGQLDAHLVNV